MSPAPRPIVRLQATEPDRVAALRVLAAELAGFPNAPQVELFRPDQTAPDDGLTRATLMVLDGDTLPGDLIEAAHARRIGLIWVEAGERPRLDRRGLLPGRLRRCLLMMDAIHARDDVAARALARLVGPGVPVQTGGALARDPAAPPCNALELDALRAALGGRPVWFAYSLPPGECDAVLTAQVAAMRLAHRLLLILAPRDPRDGPELADRARALGLTAARRQAEEEIDESVQVYVADAEDGAGLFLRLAPVTYLGGSLTPGAGTPPPVEAAALGTALIFGPERRGGFPDQLRQVGGGRAILRPAELGPALSALLDPEAGARAALQAWTLATRGAQATWTTARAICDWLILNPRPALPRPPASLPGRPTAPGGSAGPGR